MTIKPATIRTRLSAFEPVSKGAPFTAEQYAKLMGIPRGTASATLSQAVRESILSYENTRPRKYKFPPKAPTVPAPNIDELLSIVAEIDAKGVKRSTIAPLLFWAANALLTA